MNEVQNFANFHTCYLPYGLKFFHKGHPKHKLNYSWPDYVPKSDDYIPDEHVIAVWIDEKDNALSWFLGVVSTVTKDAIGVTYYNPKDRERCTWTLDDTVDEIPTPKDNVIYRNVTVGYSGSRVVRCTIDKETVASINRSFADYLQTL